MTNEAKWMTCSWGGWCSLSVVNLDDPYYQKLEGIYVIRDGSSPPIVLVVGHGSIKEGLMAWSADPRLQPFSGQRLWATWTELPRTQQAGGARYLTDQLHPVVSGENSATPPIVVPTPE